MLKCPNTPTDSCNALVFLTNSSDADGKQLPGLWDFGVETIVQNNELWQTLVDIMQVNSALTRHRADALLSAPHTSVHVALGQSIKAAAFKAAVLIGSLTASVYGSMSGIRDRPSRLGFGHVQHPAPKLMDLASMLPIVSGSKCGRQ